MDCYRTVGRPLAFFCSETCLLAQTCPSSPTERVFFYGVQTFSLVLISFDCLFAFQKKIYCCVCSVFFCFCSVKNVGLRTVLSFHRRCETLCYYFCYALVLLEMQVVYGIQVITCADMESFRTEQHSERFHALSMQKQLKYLTALQQVALIAAQFSLLNFVLA